MVRPLIAALLLLSSACAPTIQLEVMRAADLTVPARLRTVAIVDRSEASNLGQQILGALEGIATGEGLGADQAGRQQAIAGLTDTLATSPRYEVVRPVLEDVETNLFDRELTWPTARRICRVSHCDAILALEAFDSDIDDAFSSRQIEETLSSGVKVNRLEHSVERRTRVLTAWRLYDPANEVIIDDMRDHTEVRSWRESGDTRELAMSRLPSQTETVRTVAWQAGVGYARRIAPTPILVSRTYYGGGHDVLKLAKRQVRARDWAGAAETWRTLREDPDLKIRGRAGFNLALFNEYDGRLERAVEFAREAAVDLGNGRSRRYVVTLEGRIRDRDRVQEQLAPPPETDPEVRPKVRPDAADP